MHYLESDTVFFLQQSKLAAGARFFFGANHQPYSKLWVAMAHLVIPDILIYIFEQFLEPFAPYLGYSDLSACCLVCKRWQTFAQTVLFRHAFFAHSQQLSSFLNAITQTYPPSLPINKHRRELARAVRSIRYAIDPTAALSVLRHCENLVEFQEIWSLPEQGPPLKVEVFRRANNAHLQSLSAHIEDMTLLDVLDFVGIWKDTLRHLRLDVRMPDRKPVDGVDKNSQPQHEEVASLEHCISGYSLKSFHWLEGGSETKQPSLEWIENFLGKSHGMLQVFCCPNLPTNILDRILARHASTLIVLYTNKACLEVIGKHIPAMSALEELYLGGTVDDEVRTLVSLVEAGNLPRLRLLWIEKVHGELLLKTNLFDSAIAMHLKVVGTTTKASIRGQDLTSAGQPKLVWGKDGALVRVPWIFYAATNSTPWPSSHHRPAHTRIDISHREPLIGYSYTVST